MSDQAGQTYGQTIMPERANQEQPATDEKSWTIKSVPVEVRQRATKAARAQDQTMAEWITDAVNNQADRQAANLVIPPGKPEPPRNPETMPSIDLLGLAALIDSTVSAAEAAGKKPPAGLAREAAAMARQAMRAARGLPGLPARQTTRRNRQTTPLLESGDLSQP